MKTGVYGQIDKLVKAAAVAAIFASLSAAPVLAQSADLGLNSADFGLPTMDITVLVGNLVRATLGLVGVIMIVNVIHAGFLIMTHGGNEEAKEKAFEALKSSVIGLIIILSAGSIARFVISAIVNATGYSSPLS